MKGDTNVLLVVKGLTLTFVEGPPAGHEPAPASEGLGLPVEANGPHARAEEDGPLQRQDSNVVHLGQKGLNESILEKIIMVRLTAYLFRLCVYDQIINNYLVILVGHTCSKSVYMTK